MAETSNALALDDDAFEKLVSEHVSARLREQLAEHSEGLLLWLALAPAWPRRYVEAGFPTRRGMATGPAAVAAVDHAVASGLAQSGRNDADRATPIYWMTQVQADSILAFFKKQTSGTSGIREALTAAAHALRRASTASPLSEDLERWCLLGEAGPSEQAMADVLDRQIGAALRDAESRHAISCPEARRWIETATPIADVLSGPLRVALLRAKRRFELFHRRATDRRFLVNFLERESQLVPFFELLVGPDDRWALHYVGGGGAGKTMLIRHLTADLAPTLGLAVARVDFDHLNPEYPTRAPALLLAAFAEELRLHENTTSSGFDYFYSAVNTLHESVEARGGTSGGEDAIRAAEPAIRTFIDALRKLEMRPLLILDTCEELAKLQPDGRMPDNVRVTFNILERIHSELPSLRVVFSGRRPLAGKGNDWECPASPLVPRDYLRLHVLSGFNREEATAFLEAFRERDRPVPSDTFATILERSITSDTTFGKRFVWTGGPGDERAAERYNPFDLSMYASLAAGDRLKPGVGKHAYVRERIVDRLPRLLGPLTPALVTLGTFDRGLIEALCAGVSVSAETLADEVSQQHWIGRVASAGDASDEPRWKVDDIDRRRLREYYEEEGGSSLSDAQRQLATILPRLTLDRWWKELDIAYFDATLQVLQHDRDRTLRWWDGVEEKIAADAEWDWAKRMTASLLASEDGSWEGAAAKVPDPLIRASLLATHAAASARMQRSADEGLWETVRETTFAGVSEDIRAVRLRRRAVAGIVNAMQWSSHPVEMLVDRLSSRLGIEPVFDSDASLAVEVAFCEGAIEILERAGADAWHEARIAEVEIERNVVGRLQARLPDGELEVRAPLLAATWESLHARLAVLCGDVEEADRLFHHSLRRIEGAVPGCTYLDWTPPTDPVSRLRLEAVRGLALRFDVRRLEMPPVSLFWSLDSDRLASAIRIATNNSPLIDAIPSPPRPPRNIVEPALCNAHRLIPSELATDIEQQAARGSVGAALKRCRTAIRDSEQSTDVLMQDDLARLHARLVCRYRLFDDDESLSPILLESNQFEDQELVIRYAALSGGRLRTQQDPRKNLYFESRQYGVRARSVTQVVYVKPPDYLGDSSFRELWLDLFRAIAFLRQRESPFRQQAIGWAAAKERDPIDGIRVATMILSLDVSQDGLAVLTALGARAGFRRAAEVIVEECELAAMTNRLENDAPLTLAAEWFRTANDSFGAFRANVVATMGDKSSMTFDSIIESLPPGLPFPTVDEIRPNFGSQRSLRGGVAGREAAMKLHHNLRTVIEKIENTDTVLRPWVVRGIAACLRLAGQAPAPGRRTLLARRIHTIRTTAAEQFVSWIEERGQPISPDLARLLRLPPKPVEAPASALPRELFTVTLAALICTWLAAFLWQLAGPIPIPFVYYSSLFRWIATMAASGILTVGLIAGLISYLRIRRPRLIELYDHLRARFARSPDRLPETSAQPEEGVEEPAPVAAPEPGPVTALITSLVRRFDKLMAVVLFFSVVTASLWRLLAGAPSPIDSLGSAIAWGSAAIVIIALLTKGPSRDIARGLFFFTSIWMALYWVIAQLPGETFGPSGSFLSIFSMGSIVSLLAYSIVGLSRLTVLWARRVAELRDQLRIREAHRLHFDVPKGTMTLRSWAGSLIRNVTYRGPLSVETPYVLLQNEFVKETAASLSQWSSRVSRRSLPIEIMLPEEKSTDICWEAMVGPPLFVEKSLPFLSHRCFATTFNTAFNFPRLGTVAVMSTGGGGGASYPWAPVMRSSGYLFRRVDATYVDGTERASISHLVGIPVEVRGGIRLGLSDVRAGRNSLVDPASPSLRASRLCIIQGRASDVTIRTETDRVVAGQLRRFGAEVFTSSKVPVVMVIPPLPTTTADAVIHEIALALAKRRLRTVDDFEQLTGRIRKMIIDDAGGSGQSGLRTRFRDAAVERAYDVCVYLDFVPDLRPKWRWFRSR